MTPQRPTAERTSWWTDLPLDRPVATLMFLISLMVLGTVAIFQLPLGFMPTVEPPIVMVNVSYPGSHPLENLRQIVEPLEEEIATVSDIESLRARAESGQAWVRAEFGWEVDVDLKKLEVREAVERAVPRLPDDLGRITYRTFQSGPADGAILEGRISAERDLSESWELLDRRIKRPLERISGVGSVELGGVEPQEVRIEIDPEAMKRHDVQPRTLVQTLQGANLDLDLGSVEGDVLTYGIRSLGRFESTEEIAELPLPGREIQVGDVATVAVREAEITYGRHLNRKFAISLEVFKEPSANTVATVDRLLGRIDQIQEDPELQGIQLLVWNNAGEEIKSSLAGLRNAGIFGGFLAIGVLYLFLRRMRTTLVVGVAIPFSLLVTCGVMFLMGSQFNVLTMLGLMLGVGMLVDNAVVVIENIHRLEQEGMEPEDAARLGSRQVSLAVLAATATTVFVWSWLFLADPGPMTIYLGAVALTICSAVICSLIVSLTFIPLAAARFVPSRPVEPGFLLRWLVPKYREFLAWTLRHRFVTLIVLLALASSAALPIAKIEKSGEPKERKVYAEINLNAQDPTTKEKMEGHVETLEEWLWPRREELGIENLYSYYNERGWGVIRAYVPREEATEEKIAELEREFQEDLPVIPGLELNVGEQEWWRHGGGDRRLVSVALHGEDPEYLLELGREVEDQLKAMEDPQVIDVMGPSFQGQQEAQVVVDPEKARALGVSPRDVAEAVSLTYRGRNLSRFQTEGNELEMIVSLPEGLQPGVSSLEDLPIPRERGDTIPLGTVARVEVSRTDPRIDRENRMTTTWISVEFEKEVTTEEAKDRVSDQLATLDLPEGYFWDWGEWGRHRQEGLSTMFQGVVMSLIAVLLLMAALFESFSQPLAILITLPLAFFGAFWLLWLLGYELEIIGFMGVIILIGIVVNNGIVLVDHVNQLRWEGIERREALLKGCGERLRPVLMTAITTIFGLIPLAFSDFTVATAYIDSLAVVVIGGLATSTVFTLVGLPVWYSALEDIFGFARRMLPKRARERAAES
ncbi:MAG: efflux RND transporter permease subunit [Thermoanaerobaculia bacterium]|nr:efflux RND transporter permease subunit [Thermoanaerobaculia bacterium]